MSLPRVLFVDDDVTLRKVLSREIKAFGYEVDAFADATGVIDHVRVARPDCALIDLRLPGIDGMELLRRLREVEPELPWTILTGHGAVPEAVRAIPRGSAGFLAKPGPV